MVNGLFCDRLYAGISMMGSNPVRITEPVKSEDKEDDMILRELTEKEKAELARIKVSGEVVGYQVLLGLIAIDLMGDAAYDHPLTEEEFRGCVADTDGYKKTDPWIFPPVVDTWVRKTAGCEGQSLSQKKKEELAALTFTLTDTVCGLYVTMYGKKYKEMVKFYKEQEEVFAARSGMWIENSPEDSYRFIVAFLEYMGYTREASQSEKTVDVSEIPFWGFVEL